MTSTTPLEEIARLLRLRAAAEHLRGVEAAENLRKTYAPAVNPQSNVSHNAALSQISRQMRFQEALKDLPDAIQQAQFSYESTRGMNAEVREWHLLELRRLKREKDLLERAFNEGAALPSDVDRARAVVRAALLDAKIRLKAKHTTSFGVLLEK